MEIIEKIMELLNICPKLLKVEIRDMIHQKINDLGVIKCRQCSQDSKVMIAKYYNTIVIDGNIGGIVICPICNKSIKDSFKMDFENKKNRE